MNFYIRFIYDLSKSVVIIHSRYVKKGILILNSFVFIWNDTSTVDLRQL